MQNQWHMLAYVIFFLYLCGQIVCMRFLLIILAVMTWTVESKNSVSGDGTWPYDIEVSYSNTYTKGNVRKGDVATLTISHLENIDVERVEVYVNSNQSSGAGVFTLTIDGDVAATKSGTFKDWTGAYDNTAFHSITLLSEMWPGVDELEISLTGTENSLHIEKYVITYSAPAPRTVTLMHGADEYTVLEETYAGAGVTLPELPDENNWHFIGWSETEFYETVSPPYVYPADQLYYPHSDGTLWAAYAYQQTHIDTCVRVLQTGKYVYFNSENGLSVAGVPSGGRMACTVADPQDTDQQYRVEFNAACDSATIQHIATGTYIGYSGTQLSARKSAWSVFHAEDKTAFYCTVNNKTYIFWPSLLDGSGYYAGLLQTDNIPSTPTALIGCEAVRDVAYTCHPEYDLPVETVPADSEKETIIPFGVYELHIRNGQKTLKVVCGY